MKSNYKIGETILVRATVMDLLPAGELKCSVYCRAVGCPGGIIAQDTFRVDADFTHKLPDDFDYNNPPVDCKDEHRPFKEGDIVEPCTANGRWLSPVWEGRSGMRFIVTRAEDDEGYMIVHDRDIASDYEVISAFFRLVIPVEHVRPYSVGELRNHAWPIMRDNCIHNYYPFGEGCAAAEKSEALAVAQAECDRLNKIIFDNLSKLNIV